MKCYILNRSGRKSAFKHFSLALLEMRRLKQHDEELFSQGTYARSWYVIERDGWPIVSSR